MKIKARIDRMVSGDRVKAIASVSLDGQYVVKGLRVVDGNKGLFVAPPQSSYKDGEGNTKGCHRRRLHCNAAPDPAHRKRLCL